MVPALIPNDNEVTKSARQLATNNLSGLIVFSMIDLFGFYK